MTVLRIALTGYLAMTLLFPAIQKFRARGRLSSYYAELFNMNEPRARAGIVALCAIEAVLAVLLVLHVQPIITGVAVIALFLGFLAFRLRLLQRFNGTADCGCNAETGATTRSESRGGVAGVSLLVVFAFAWTLVAI
ncbi:MauE/DoxX family redox-associated membrane protein [Arthrobacter sp. NA-172]|uniref:MauE/DoxX family redox-associated membrane protein n=1 Tax=Arthrobacter sp. NA-172 TaxID=3367524 RepID=UPI003754F50A